MLKSSKKVILGLIAAALTVLASAGVASACLYVYYEPEMPKAYQK